MSSNSSCQRRRSSKKKDKESGDFYERIRKNKVKDKGAVKDKVKDNSDVDRISECFSQKLIYDSDSLTSYHKEEMRKRYKKPPLIAGKSRPMSPEKKLKKKEKWAADLEDSTQKKKKPNSIREEDCYFVFDFADLEDCYKNPRHPDLVKEDPEGKLIPKEIPGHPFGFLEVPPGVTCDVCGRSEHWSSCCPYFYDFPPYGSIKNPDSYRVVCDCGNPEVEPPFQGCRECVTGRGFHVVPKYDPCSDDDIEFNPTIHLLNTKPDRDSQGNPVYMWQRDPVETYVPG